MTPPETDNGCSEQGNWSCDAIGLADPKDRRGSLVVAGCVAGIVVIVVAAVLL